MNGAKSTFVSALRVSVTAKGEEVVSHKGTPEQILTGIANDLKPGVERAIAELGRDQVIKNLDAAIEGIAANRIKRIRDRLNMRDKTPDEARAAIRYVIEFYPDHSRFIYPALANKTWLLLHQPYSEEIRDWHALVRATQASVGDRDKTTVERLNVLADLLRESIAQFVIRDAITAGAQRAET